MPLSDYMETQIIQSIIDAGPNFVALYTVAPSDASAGTEVVGGTYTRQQVSWAFAPGSGAAIRNTAALSFVGLPACTVVAIGIFDVAGSGANLILYGVLPAPVTYADGVTGTVDASALQFTLD